jgi:hypothetical protein
MRYRDIFVREGRFHGVALLYHGTRADLALEIFRDGMLKPLTVCDIDGKSVKGVSLTRSVGFASVYNDIILGFDAARVREAFRGRLKPYVDPQIGNSPTVHADYRREAEEFLIGPLPLNGFLRAFWINETPNYIIEPAERAQLTAHPLYVGPMKNMWKS